MRNEPLLVSSIKKTGEGLCSKYPVFLHLCYNKCMKLNTKLLKKHWKAYRESTILWSYSGFLVYLGVDRLMLERIKRLALSGDTDALEMIAFLHKVQYEYATFLDEVLVYQYAHPVFKALKIKHYDFNSLRYVSATLRRQLMEYDSLNVSRSESKLPLLENKSEVKLLAQVQKLEY